MLDSARSVSSLSLVANNSDDPLSELLFRKTVRQHVREFGATFGIVFCAVSAYYLFKRHDLAAATWSFLAALLFPALSYLAPQIMRHPWRAWMKLGHAIGMVVTTLILSVLWVSMFIPCSFGLRLFGKTVMDMHFREDKPSYWLSREKGKDDFLLLKRQF